MRWRSTARWSADHEALGTSKLEALTSQTEPVWCFEHASARSMRCTVCQSSMETLAAPTPLDSDPNAYVVTCLEPYCCDEAEEHAHPEV